jgi:hypothetical protein
LAEAATEEASKKLKDLGLEETLGISTTREAGEQGSKVRTLRVILVT